MKLVTWNVQWGRGVDGRVDLSRIVDDARRFTDFDVLCLQEVASNYPELAGSDSTDQFAALSELLPGFTAIAGVATDAPGPDERRRAFGNMIFSRFPVMQVFRHLLPWPADPGVQSMQRLALEATLATPLGLVRVTTTHLEYFSEKQRRAQVERLRELQRDAVAHARTENVAKVSSGPFFTPPRGAQAILTGDMNCPPDAEERMRLMQAIDAVTPAYRDAWEILHPGVPHPPTVGLYDKVQWPDAPFTFDFIFVSEDLASRLRRVEIEPHGKASDHQPVMIELA
jgi:endonuclease/exonuclease/phosphatase family metal-dependent hydrolase